MNFYPSDDDVQGQDRVGDVIYLATALFTCCFLLLPLFCDAQCWEKVFEHSCFKQEICDFKAEVKPPAQYDFKQGWFWIQADKCTYYTATIGGTACDGVCDQGDFTQLEYNSPCCTKKDTVKLSECGINEPYGYFEQIDACKCDTLRRYEIQPLPVYSLNDTIPHPTNDITIDSLKTVAGCDSIITTYWVATDFESPQTTQKISYNNDAPPKSNCPGTDIIESGNDTIMDLIEPTKVYAPSIFSPNGDGINDCFQVFTNGAIIQSVIIADRWGNIVKQTGQIKSGECIWDGYYKTFLVPGVCVYSAMVNDRVYKGNFTTQL